MANLDVEVKTKHECDGYVRRTLRPALGTVPLARLDAPAIESLYAQLHRCRRLCRSGTSSVDHGPCTRSSAGRRAWPSGTAGSPSTRARCAEMFAHGEAELTGDHSVFSVYPARAKPRNLDGISNRYRRMAGNLGIDTHIHTVRHYSATELLSTSGPPR